MKKVLLTPYIFKNKYKKIVLSLNLEWFKYLTDLGFVTNFANPFISIDTQIKHMDMIIISGGGDLNSIKKTNVNLFRDRFEKFDVNDLQINLNKTSNNLFKFYELRFEEIINLFEN